LGLQPTGRAAKSTTAIIEKLRRESIRLTQIQDIAGCRLIVSNLAEQDRVVSDLRSAFTDVRVVDRRQKPSHGYRAVHVIVQSQDRVAEIQVRTLLQHGWAEVSEKVSDNVGKDIKYGGGSESLRSRLLMMSELIARNEEAEAALAAYAEKSDPDASERRVGASDLERALRSVAEARESMRRDLAMLISRFADPGVNDAVSD
jgi:ppGpp synthetase/RelA/SpoT-type nucleotidyltranferase